MVFGNFKNRTLMYPNKADSAITIEEMVNKSMNPIEWLCSGNH